MTLSSLGAAARELEEQNSMIRSVLYAFSIQEHTWFPVNSVSSISDLSVSDLGWGASMELS